MTTKLRTRKPTGVPPWPMILLEGEEKSGKTWAALQFSGDPRVGRAWALDLNEGSLDEYGAIPGADFELIDHNGTWADIISQLTAAREEARRDRDAGKPPCLLVVDTITAEWAMLKAWVDVRARRQPANAAKLREDPDAEYKASRDKWNDADARHQAFMTLLHTFPGIVIVTARGKEIGATGEDGQPVIDRRTKQPVKDYRVQGQKDIGFDVNAWIRIYRTGDPEIIGLRSTRRDMRPGKADPEAFPDFSLGALIFDVIGCVAGQSANRDMRQLNADQVMPGEAPPADPSDEKLGKAVPTILGATTTTDAQHWLKISDQSPLRDRDVTSLISDQDRETLGVQDGQAVTLLDLAYIVGSYCTNHGDDHRCDGNEHVSAHGPRSTPENPGIPIQASNGVAAVAS